MEAIEGNDLSQALALKMHYLPLAPDTEQNLARAVWLHKNHFEQLANAVALGISKVL